MMHMIRVERMVLAPSRCFFCSRNDGPAIDTGLRERLPSGAIYICLTSCVPILIGLADGLSSEQRQHVLKRNADLLEEVKALKAELGPLRELRRSIDRVHEPIGA